MLLHNGNEEKSQHAHSSSSGFLATSGDIAMAQSSSSDEPRAMDGKTAPSCEEIEPFNINIPVFMERTFRMIDSISDDIVCWSRAGDSFIVKKASDTETLWRGQGLIVVRCCGPPGSDQPCHILLYVLPPHIRSFFLRRSQVFHVVLCFVVR